ncbi:MULTISPECIES: hypothetical protein [unclassified Hydrotalea]|nr:MULTISPECIES: hypothetical protein [unclassified Hydrotalea]
MGKSRNDMDANVHFRQYCNAAVQFYGTNSLLILILATQQSTIHTK